MAAVTEATTAGPSEEGKKVFVGNLPFNATEKELQEIFQNHGPISDAQIIKKYSRGTRSLGYGFVTFNDDQTASAAISALDKSEFQGRTINVELAKPSTKTSRGNIAQEAAEAAGGEASTEGHEVTGDGQRGARRGRGRGRGGRGRGRGRGARGVQADGEADGVADVADQLAETHINGNATTAVGSGEERKVRGRGRGRGGAAPRRRGPPTGEASQTLLFVANLPFNLDNDGLKAIFDGYKVKDAHVVVRKYGPVTGRSKGFGFVDLEDHAEQQKVLHAFNGKNVDGREIQVKVAIESAEGDNTEANAAETAS